MTNTYNTGNPLGSTDPRDLYDNASNFDDGMNSASPAFTDRLGVMRKSWNGMETEFSLAQSGREAEFQQFLTDSSFVSLGNYAPGLNFTAYNQYMARDGFFYRPAPSSIPFTTTGTWVGGDEDLFNLFSADDVLRRDLADATDPSKGAGMVGYRGRTAAQRLGDTVSVKDFGAVGDGVTDDTAAIQAAIDSFGAAGGSLHLPAGVYRCTATIYLKSGVSLTGDGLYGANVVGRVGGSGISVLYGEHIGAAVLSLKGCIGAYVHNLSLYGSFDFRPKTGLCLGRGATLDIQCAYNEIHRISVVGFYTSAAIYSIAAELNVFSSVLAWEFGGTANYTFLTSNQDIFGVDGMAESTNIGNTVLNCNFFNTSPAAGAAGIYLECGRDMGNWTFSGCYVTQYAGAYVRIGMGNLSASAPFGPFTFSGLSGELLSGGAPKFGFDITSTSPVALAGLSITGSRLQLPANVGGDIYDIYQGAFVTLVNPNINIQPPEAFPYAESSVRYDKIRGGMVSVGRQYEWTDVTLLNGWVNDLGTPYPSASYRVDPTGEVSFRGLVSSGTGFLFSMPEGLKPGGSMVFSTTTSAGVGRLIINAAGEVSLQSGATDSVDLSTLRFRP